MTFSSAIFLIGLVPWFVIIYKFLGKKSINTRIVLIILANSLFYIWAGTGAFLFICLFSAVVWLLSLLIFRVRKKAVLYISVLVSIAPLFCTKYLVQIIKALNAGTTGEVALSSIVVPLGISFITFNTISLLTDIYRGEIEKNPNIINTYLYLTFFPTVTSGPLIRYNTFSNGLNCASCPFEFSDSIERILIGLSKKVLLADKIAVLADYYFNGVASGKEYSVAGLWIGSVAYTLQLYFDFSGYSDMAIGIGRLLGFDIAENFNNPYQAGDISDFWKRWHISLTRWFRDYVYIPLGGNRCSVPRHLLNMLIVWLLTGIWHGADFSFVIWGLGHFLLLVFEKYVGVNKEKRFNLLTRIYTLFFVNLLWVPFRASNMAVAAKYIVGMFGGGSGSIEDKAIHFIPLLLIGIIACLPWKRYAGVLTEKKWYPIIKGIMLLALLVLAVCATTNSSYAPYIYGNF